MCRKNGGQALWVLVLFVIGELYLCHFGLDTVGRRQMAFVICILFLERQGYVHYLNQPWTGVIERVERRGTLESQQQQVANQSAQQQQQHHPRSSSNLNLPLSQGSDRSIHRSESNIHFSLSTLNPSSSTSSTSSISAPHPTEHGSHQRPPPPQSPPPSIALFLRKLRMIILINCLFTISVEEVVEGQELLTRTG